MLAAYTNQIAHRRLHLAAIVLAAVSVVATILHYEARFPGNPLTWSAWILAIAAFTGSFLKPNAVQLPRSMGGVGSTGFGTVLLVLPLYLITHLWNYASAPWNSNGLFDDAAWDIYFARTHAFAGPFQAAFFDQVGLISRETVFHYYITACFRVFGYNLLVFNGALLVLGFVTVAFTTLTVRRLFRTPAITIAAALLMNFLPLHYLQVFVGHRYAIAAPLMMVSLYLLYSGFQDRSPFRLSLSALFAALCLDSAIMGKQFILGLAAAAVVLLVIDRKRWASAETRALAMAWIGGFLIAATPLLVYVVFNRDQYFGHEQGLLTDFASLYINQGYAGIQPFVDQLGELFFDGDTFRRLWLHDFPLVPPAYWLLLLPGLLIALRRRRIEIALLAVIPVGSAFLSGAYDFRVLLAAPIWVIAMTYALDAIGLGRAERPLDTRRLAAQLGTVAIVVAGLLPSAAYLWGVSLDSHAEYLLRHRDVAVSRLIQDVVAGSPQPSADMKPNEFDRSVTPSALAFDALACLDQAYAVAHLYLQPFDDHRILAFCDGGNEALIGKDHLLETNVRAIAAYEPRDRGLKLIWEESPISQEAISRFGPLERFGSAERLGGSVDGEPYSIYVLTIPSQNVVAFRAAVAAAYPDIQP